MSQWWIDVPVFLGSSSPTTEELKNHYQLGFRTIISLLDENEQRPYYDLSQALAMGFDWIRIPIKDFTAPTQEQFMQFLEVIDRALKNGKVVMHCRGGLGRTGTMAAAYWIDKGLSVGEALKKIHASNPAAVENPVQEKSLRELERILKCKSQNLI